MRLLFVLFLVAVFFGCSGSQQWVHDERVESPGDSPAAAEAESGESVN